MNKSLYIICLGIVALLLASCSKDEAIYSDETDTCSVTFSAFLDVEMQGRALGEGTAVSELVYAVYEGGKPVTDNVASPQPISPGTPAAVSLKLIKGRTYDVAFWAQAKESPYTLNCELAMVAYKQPQRLLANQDAYDAFWKVVRVTADANGMQAVTLVRPFAQLNIGTDDFAHSAFNGQADVKSALTVTAPSGMNLLSGEVLAPASELVFSENTIPADQFQVGGDSYTYLAMNYLFAGAEAGQKVECKLSVKAEQTNSEVSFTAIPLQRNYRTNVYGSLLNKVRQQASVRQTAIAATLR